MMTLNVKLRSSIYVGYWLLKILGLQQWLCHLPDHEPLPLLQHLRREHLQQCRQLQLGKDKDNIFCFSEFWCFFLTPQAMFVFLYDVTWLGSHSLPPRVQSDESSNEKSGEKLMKKPAAKAKPPPKKSKKGDGVEDADDDEDPIDPVHQPLGPRRDDDDDDDDKGSYDSANPSGHQPGPCKRPSTKSLPSMKRPSASSKRSKKVPCGSGYIECGCCWC